MFAWEFLLFVFLIFGGGHKKFCIIHFFWFVLCFSLSSSSVCLGVDICLRSIWGGGEKKKFCIVSRQRAIALLPSVPETNCSTDKNRLLFENFNPWYAGIGFSFYLISFTDHVDPRRVLLGPGKLLWVPCKTLSLLENLVPSVLRTNCWTDKKAFFSSKVLILSLESVMHSLVTCIVYYIFFHETKYSL